MQKNALFIILGIIAGSAVGAGATIFILREAVSMPNTTALYKTVDTDNTTLPLHTGTILIPKALVSEEYHILLNRIVSTINQATTNNNEKIVPLMKMLDQKSKNSEWSGIFDIILSAKKEIKENEELVAGIQADINTLKDINILTTLDKDILGQTVALLELGNPLTNAFIGYFETLGQFLTGKAPTQDLIDSLEEKITNLAGAGKDFQQKLNILLSTVKQKISDASRI